ncbi:MAG TPA: hypothetical protein VGA02_10555 [Gemmatimonadales bacterium]|jgi:hypothetical protein
MSKRIPLAALAALVLTAGVAAAQASFTPSFNAPYRAFERHEFGATGAWVGFDNVGIEGQFRFGYKKFDIGIKGGYIDNPGTGAGGSFVLGGEGRMRLLEHSESFPLDGAFVAGIGTVEFDAWMVPMAGLSLGRRVDLEGVSFVAYAQPTLGFVVVDGPADDDLRFGLGFGADFKVGSSLDLRTSIGFFDVGEGLAVSLVWVR